MIVRFDNKGIQRLRAEHSIGVDGDRTSAAAGGSHGVSEADHILADAKRQLDGSGGTVPVIPAAGMGSEEIIAEDREGENEAARLEQAQLQGADAQSVQSVPLHIPNPAAPSHPQPMAVQQDHQAPASVPQQAGAPTTAAAAAVASPGETPELNEDALVQAREKAREGQIAAS